MRLSLGLCFGKQKSGPGTPAAGPSIDTPGSIDVSSFNIGALHTITAGTASATGGGSISYEYQFLADAVAVDTTADYAWQAADDTKAGVAQWRAVETGGTNPGATSWQTVASGTIRYAAGAAPAIADGQAWTVDDTSVNINAAASGANLTWTYVLTGSTAGVTINPSTGAITGTPTGVDSGTATVTATDQYGREVSDTFTWSAALRTQATAADGLGPFSWTVDDTSVNVDATTDFTTNGNTLTYTATGLPAGVTIATNGIISGTPTAASSGSIVITGQDEYGRDTTSTTSHTTALRTQATGGADLDLAFPEDSAIATTDLLANWTLNGNTPTTLVSVSPTLPTGLSAAIGGGTVQLTGTPTTVTADNTYTVTVADEYGRQTADTFTLEITAGVATIAITSIGPQAANGDVPVSYTIDQDDGTVEAVLFAAAEANPAAADFNGGGAPTYVDQGTVALTTTGSPINLTMTGTFNGSVKLALLPTGGGDGDVVVSDAFDLDTTTPSLSSPTNAAASATSVTWGVTSNEAGGTIFAAARLASDAVLSKANIENGTGDAVATGTDASPTANSSNGGTLTGLTTGTEYDVDMFQRDANGNESAVVSSAAATTWAVPSAFVDANWSVATGSGANELDITIASLPAANGASITDLEYDVAASGSWTSLGGTAGPFTITMAAPGTSYSIRLRAVNSVGNGAPGNAESATSGAASYTDNYVDTQGTAYFTWARANTPASPSGLTFAIRQRRIDTGIKAMLDINGGGTRIGTYGTGIQLLLQLDGGAYSDTHESGMLPVTTETLLVVAVDLTASAPGLLQVQVNGTEFVGSGINALTGTNTNIQWDRDSSLLGTFGGGALLDTEVSELFVHNAYINPATLWNGGTKDNLATLAGVTPLVYFGNGQAATAWNAPTNLGSATIGIGSADFIEA